MNLRLSNIGWGTGLTEKKISENKICGTYQCEDKLMLGKQYIQDLKALILTNKEIYY